jgi:hypothetical protein
VLTLTRWSRKNPQNPNLDDLALTIKQYADLNKKTKDLIPRMREMVPKLRGDAGKPFQEAQQNYQKKVDLIGVKLNEMQKRIDELKAKEPKVVGQDAPSAAERQHARSSNNGQRGFIAGDPDAIMKIVDVPMRGNVSVRGIHEALIQRPYTLQKRGGDDVLSHQAADFVAEFQIPRDRGSRI